MILAWWDDNLEPLFKTIEELKTCVIGKTMVGENRKAINSLCWYAGWLEGKRQERRVK